MDRLRPPLDHTRLATPIQSADDFLFLPRALAKGFELDVKDEGRLLATVGLGNARVDEENGRGASDNEPAQMGRAVRASWRSALPRLPCLRPLTGP